MQEKYRLGFFFAAIGIFYYISIVLLRIPMPFDKFDYRIMSPAVLPLGLGLFWFFIQKTQTHKIATAGIIILFLFSLVFNLPKQYLWEWIRNL
ncbi:MAG: hypothetical protein H7Y04_11125 [Verrucomicrobia bacterium]|nr:hypothetical protein [Cytophagales bacterium]